MDRLIKIFVRDKYGAPLPGANIAVFLGAELFAEVEASEGQATIQVPEHERSAPVVLKVTYESEPPETVTLAPASDTFTVRFDVRGEYSKMSLRRILWDATLGVAVVLALIGAALYLGLLAGQLPLALGVVLVAAALILAFTFSSPNALQQQLIRSTFALGAGGLASQIPGLLEVNVTMGTKAAIAAGGAIAVYVLTFFFVPARQNPD